ncbi:MAG TPA: hypothetical protein VL988_06375 [Solirubrobacteraceae bacterium]|nr:hypothetical protein [Solirubrobacteraceae bacterium]
MPTYAQSRTAPSDYGFPIFYEILSLDEALAEEDSAIAMDREVFGDGFEGFRAGQLNRVRALYESGAASGTAYSVRAPEGEWSSAIPLADLLPIVAEQFNAARASNWTPTS